MRLTRQEAVDALLETESMVRHGYSTVEIRQMAPDKLCRLINDIFEPIDLEDPYTVNDKKVLVPAAFSSVA